MLKSFRSPWIKGILAYAVSGILLTITGIPALGAWIYRVNSGDSLHVISRKVDVPALSIQKANGLGTSRISAGQKLVIPDTTKKAPSTGWIYRVKRGDSLYSIGRKVGISHSQLSSANQLNDTRIRPGQTLVIPQAAGGSRPTRVVTTSRGSQVSDSANVDVLARLIHAEARGEKFLGQVAVGAVIVNRTQSRRFPGTIAGVVYAPGQFCTVRDGQINMKPNAEAYRAARAALSGWDPTGGALYFYNPAKTTSKWIWSRPVNVRIGSHVFAR